MDDRYKPAGRDFDVCAAGRMLILSANLPGELTHNAGLAMNGFV